MKYIDVLTVRKNFSSKHVYPAGIELVRIVIAYDITGPYIMEASTEMDVLAVRKKYPNLQILGSRVNPKNWT
ncbi:MAG: hypothetical protein IMZ59_07450 [Actinobacteria bacterium]|nr:hypothetical protein [Actinomycetota bacterium]